MPDSVASANMSDKFNQHVEAYLLFICHYIVFHLIDRCTRWHAAKVIPNKEEATLVDAIDELWIKLHGPMGELIMGGGSGVA